MLAPVWIRLYSLPFDLWEEEIFEGIGNALESFVKISEVTKKSRYTSYARICAYLNVSRALPNSICLWYQDLEWIQSLDYKHIPFHYIKCHEHGHLLWYCPLNRLQDLENTHQSKDEEGFETVNIRLRNNRKQAPLLEQPEIPTTNKFNIL